STPSRATSTWSPSPRSRNWRAATVPAVSSADLPRSDKTKRGLPRRVPFLFPCLIHVPFDLTRPSLLRYNQSQDSILTARCSPMRADPSPRVHGLVLCALFAALTAVCSQIALPMPWGVPINLAIFAVCLSGSLLGPVRGMASMAVYVALAAVGVPVLAGFQGGPAAIFGKTGGYVIGYMAA